jgi:hypothetical protein
MLDGASVSSSSANSLSLMYFLCSGLTAAFAEDRQTCTPEAAKPDGCARLPVLDEPASEAIPEDELPAPRDAMASPVLPAAP